MCGNPLFHPLHELGAMSSDNIVRMTTTPHAAHYITINYLCKLRKKVTQI
jgi:hypothetical protein